MQELTREQIEAKLREFGNINYQHISKSDIMRSFLIDYDEEQEDEDLTDNIMCTNGVYYNTSIPIKYEPKSKQCNNCNRIVNKTQVLTKNLKTGSVSCNICNYKT